MKNLNSLINLSKSLAITSILAFTVSAVHGDQQVVSINFDTDESNIVDGLITGTTGVISEAPADWREISFTGTPLTVYTQTTTAGQIKDNDGNEGNATLTITGANYNSSVSALGNIFETYVDKTSSLSITGITYHSYDVYLYVDSDTDNRGGTITDDQTSTSLGYRSFAHGTAAAGVFTVNSTTSAQNEVSAVEFTGLTTSTASFTFVGNFSGNNSGIAAIQIVNTGADVPEPSTYSMIALAIGGMMVFGWTRRNRHSA